MGSERPASGVGPARGRGRPARRGCPRKAPRSSPHLTAAPRHTHTGRSLRGPGPGWCPNTVSSCPLPPGSTQAEWKDDVQSQQQLCTAPSTLRAAMSRAIGGAAVHLTGLAGTHGGHLHPGPQVLPPRDLAHTGRDSSWSMPVRGRGHHTAKQYKRQRACPPQASESLPELFPPRGEEGGLAEEGAGARAPAPRDLPERPGSNPGCMPWASPPSNLSHRTRQGLPRPWP